ncbi:MAG: PIN domain-containing protein [Defluviitaleaceae bacterium]|nr:PIN domain-containing protein [Defluviitaleaceae bacterium]
MCKPKIYLETTMFNYYFDTERDAHPATVKLFQEIKARKYEAYTSLYVMDEIVRANEPKKSNMLALVDNHNIKILKYSDEAQNLAEIYVKEGVIPKSKTLDSLHISVATVNNLQYVFSFNFRHINRAKTKEMTSIINLREGYRPVTIVTPAEVIIND